MIKLPSIFSDGALYQHRSTLTIHGYTDADKPVAVSLLSNNTVVTATKTQSGKDGCFVADIETPEASFHVYGIEISVLSDSLDLSKKIESVTLNNIMFGELWLASGQSNMELTNMFMTDCREYLMSLEKHKLRFFMQEYGDAVDFPYEGSDELNGKWSDSGDMEGLMGTSAAGTAFMAEIYAYLNRTENDVPVGILSASWGGTPIGGWIPREELMSDTSIARILEEQGRIPSHANWNMSADVNFQQMSAMYNRKIYPLIGLKIRGIIWYQGENDCGAEHILNIYTRYLRCYYNVYKKLFAADDDNFMMISSLLYPWPYGESGETCMGHVNNAFIQCALDNPEAFSFAPIADLPPVWGYHLNNHPIHPTNKYVVGRRLGMLANTGCYGKEGQSAPATLRGIEYAGNKIVLTFDNVGNGLRIEGKKVRGLYICGGDNLYLPAECEITAPDTLSVSYPFIEKPVHAAYAFNSFEPGCNLYAGDYPVAPFKTDWSRFIKIEAKPWMNMENDAVWVNDMRGELLDIFYHAIWTPCPESEICFDTAFTLTGRSLRVYSRETEYGVSIRSHHANRLKLADFKALRLNLFNNDGLSVLLICQNTAKSMTLPAYKICELKGGWATWEVSLDSLDRTETDCMTFRFRHENNAYTFINMESLYLIPEI